MKHFNYEYLWPHFEMVIDLPMGKIQHALDEWNFSEMSIGSYDDMKIFSVFHAVF